MPIKLTVKNMNGAPLRSETAMVYSGARVVVDRWPMGEAKAAMVVVLCLVDERDVVLHRFELHPHGYWTDAAGNMWATLIVEPGE